MAKRRIGLAIAMSAASTMLLAPMAVASTFHTEDIDALLARVAPDVRENIAGNALARGVQTVTPATVPDSTDDPVTVNGATSVSVWLPGDASATSVTVADHDLYIFDYENGSANLPIPKDDGSVQILTLITDAAAPTSYDYQLDSEQSVVASLDADGLVHIAATDGHLVAGVAAAWAVDANGQTVPTHFEVNGTTLTQVVDHNESFTYPIVADPWFGQDLYQHPSIQVSSQGYQINVRPTSWGQQFAGPLTWSSHRDEVIYKLGSGQSWRWTSTINEQFYCHIAGLPHSLPVYNLESWRPVIGWSQSLVQYKCNPLSGGWS